jgi:hypothetical protein
LNGEAGECSAGGLQSRESWLSSHHTVYNSATLEAFRQSHREAGIAGEAYFHSTGIEQTLAALNAVSKDTSKPSKKRPDVTQTS